MAAPASKSASFSLQTLVEGGAGAGANLFHAAHQIADVLAALPHFLRDGGAFPLAEGVEQDQRFGGGFQNGLGDLFFNLFVAGGAQHARNAQGGVEVRLAAQPVEPGGVAKGLHVGVEQRPVQRGGGARRPGEGNLDLHVAARHPALDDAAHVVLQSVHFRGHAAVHVQAAMVHALQGRDNLAPLDVFSARGRSPSCCADS